MNKYIFILIALLAGCASQPERVTYAEIAEKYQPVELPARVIFDFDAACNDDGVCMVAEHKLDEAVSIITRLNDALQSAVTAYNMQQSGLAHCEYASALKSEALGLERDAGRRAEITATIKQALTVAGCGVLLLK